MSELNLFLRAFKGVDSPDALPDELTIEQLAELRAWSMDGLDNELYARLIRHIGNQAQLKVLRTETRKRQEWTGEWEVTRKQRPDPRRVPFGTDLPNEKLIVRVGMGSAPEGAVKVNTSVEVAVVTREAARALHALDAADWGMGSMTWAGVRVAEPALGHQVGRTEPALVTDGDDPVKAKEAVRQLEALGFGQAEAIFKHWGANYPYLIAAQTKSKTWHAKHVIKLLEHYGVAKSGATAQASVRAVGITRAK